MARSNDTPPPVTDAPTGRAIVVEFNDDGTSSVRFDDAITVFDFAAAAFLCGRAGNQLASAQDAPAPRPRLITPTN